jgi:hypothetical protein
MYTADGMYALYRKLKEVLENPTPARVKKFTTNYFKYFTDFYFNKTKNWSTGANNFVNLTNAINSGHFSLDAFCVIFIGYYITKNKFITQKEMQHIDYLEKLNKFYTIFETQKQMEFLNKEMENSVDQDDVFADFTQTKLDVYQVGEDQKNILYEYIKSGKVNLIQFVIAWHNKKFEIDEKKITDEDYFRFIQYMKIVRHNMYKVTQTTV